MGVLGTEEKKEEFKRSFVQGVATALSIDKERITITALIQGSIIVQFTIWPSTYETAAITAVQALAALQEQVQDESSEFMTGSFGQDFPIGGLVKAGSEEYETFFASKHTIVQ